MNITVVANLNIVVFKSGVRVPMLAIPKYQIYKCSTSYHTVSLCGIISNGIPWPNACPRHKERLRITVTLLEHSYL